MLLGDNFSSDVQSPRFFATWSRDYYAEAVRRLHAAGKRVAVHVDGRLRGLLRAMREIDVDCIDAVTPSPMGDLTPAQCRQEAGPGMIDRGAGWERSPSRYAGEQGTHHRRVPFGLGQSILAWRLHRL